MSSEMENFKGYALILGIYAYVKRCTGGLKNIYEFLWLLEELWGAFC